jgi:glycolate oxidase subunit GlcD
MVERSPAKLQRKLETLLGPQGVLHRPEHLLVYECDGSTAFKRAPELVVLPRSTDEVRAVVRACADAGAPFLGRGAGTGISGGAIAAEGGVIIAMNRMNRLLSVDRDNRLARVETGMVNLELSRAVAGHGLYFAPDPSSQSSCTLGGNIAENAGGPHCFKYGPTTAHVLGLTVVLPDGELVSLGGPWDTTGYDLVGFFVGSEGTLGIATEAWVRLLPLPEAVLTFLAPFRGLVEACAAVSDIVALGVVPAALEMLDRATIEVVEASVNAAGYPRDAEAVLLVEIDGPAAGMERLAREIEAVCRQRGAVEFVSARGASEREKLWKGRKGAFGAMGRLSTDLYVQDGVVPRTRLPQVLARVAEIGRHYGIRVANVFHAGDGNLHPCIAYDGRDADEKRRVLEAGRAMLELCVEVGGSISGEHGIGTEKSSYMTLLFSESDLGLMGALRDVFNPRGLCNPGKVFPAGHACGEVGSLRSAAVAGAWI